MTRSDLPDPKPDPVLHSLFATALSDYENQTGINLVDHPLVGQLENCDSVASIIAIIQEQARAFTEFRRGDDKMMKPLKRVVHVLYVLSASTTPLEGIGMLFPFAKAIFAFLAILLRAIEDIRANYDGLIDLLESIEHVLSCLDIYIKFPPTDPTVAMGDIIIKIMVELISTLALVTKQIKEKRPLKSIKRPLGEKEVDAVLNRLDRLTEDEARKTAAQTLEVVYSLVQNMKVVVDDGNASADGIRDALEIMQGIATEINKSERENLVGEVLQWLVPPDPWTNHNSARKSHHKGTSAWFVYGNTYGEWKSSGSNSYLWIHGEPGAGKSILCSTIIEDIDQMRRLGLASLAFFYCDFRDDDKKNLHGLLSSLLVQFCHSSDTYSAILSDFYSEHDGGSRHPSDIALVGCLKRILKHPGQAPVYIIIDALDECPNTFSVPSPREDVLKFVKELVDLQLTNVHICVTSRREANITDFFDRLPFHQISLDTESGQVQDIIKYIKFVAHTDSEIQNWRAADRELVIKVLSKKAGSAFRWVSCQLEVLRRCLPAFIQQALDELPESLDRTYERTLQDIDKANWSFSRFSRRLFQCVAAASRPLRIKELAEFLAFDFDAGPTPTSPAGRRPEDSISAVLTTCPNFLSIIQVEGSASIQFSHLSVKEFLTSNRLAETEDIISQYHVSMNPAHTIMAQACLGILLHLDEKVTNDSLKNFPLAEYAAKHWVDHARFDKVSANTHYHMKRLFDPRMPHLTISVWIYDPEIPQKIRSERPSQPGGTYLHYAALFGFPDLVNSLVTELSPNVNARGFSNEMTPLHLASRDGHAGVARVLLEHGADVTTQDVDMLTPLHLASGRGHVDVARVLLEHDANANAHDAEGWTALHHASRSGFMDVTLLLLDRDANARAKDVDESSPLRLASAHGQVDIARVLIKHGADVTAQDAEMSTPLHLASGRGHVDIVRVLLDCGADANAQDAEGWTPLHQASGGGYVEVARLLLEHSVHTSARNLYKSIRPPLASGHGHVDIPEADGSSWTPLHLASQEGHLEVVRLLLARGENRDPDAKNENQQTPLSLASSNGRLKVMEFLLEKGADSNSHDRQKRTPLHGASENGHFDVIFLLLERGTDVNAKDSHLWTPLHMASKTGNFTVVVELLDHGADANSQDDLGWTPLHIASQEGHQGVVRLLLNHRAHVDALEADQETALHLAAYYGHPQVTQLLFDSGANVHALNKNEKRPSDLASAEGHHRLAKILLASEEIKPVAKQEGRSQYDGAYLGPSRQPVHIGVPSSTTSSDAQPIHLHSNIDRAHNDYSRIFSGFYETPYEPRKTVVEAEKDLQDLLQQSFDGRGDDESARDEVDMSQAVVDGFCEGIRLLPYQVAGRAWMTERESDKKIGGILADDMGLGKTIQTLTRIVDGRSGKSDAEDGWAATTLVVCPVSLMSQWVSEISKIAKNLTVIEHHGPSRTTDPAALRRAHVVITSYAIVSSEHGTFDPKVTDESKPKKGGNSKTESSSDSDSEADHFGRTLVNKKKPANTSGKKKDALFRVKWWRIVLDEAHNIKNRKTKAAQGCCALEGKYRWCLTGTPLQNNVEELYSLFKFLRIKPLNDWQTFNEQINKPVKSGHSVRAMKRLHVILRAIMLRRLKTDTVNGKPLIELPERRLFIVPCDFDEDERRFYFALENKIDEAMKRFVKNNEVMKNYTNFMLLLLRLRQACNHPSLVSKDYNTDREAIESPAPKDDHDDEELPTIFKQLGVSKGKKCQLCQDELTTENKDGEHCEDCIEIARKARHKSLPPNKDSNLPPDSAKIRKLLELLKEINLREDDEGEPTGEKTIVFSQFTTMLDLIQPFLREAGIAFVRYDGSMSKEKRDASLNQIRNNKRIRVILISFKAGSTGLNLTACNNVILVDMWWNPALEDQAFDRVHRLGQTRDVNIYKLTIENTVEQRILTLQESKRALATATLGGDKINKLKLDLEDLMALFRPGREEDDD